MDDTELLSVLIDTVDGLSPNEGYGPTLQAVRDLIADRDEARADLAESERLGQLEADVANGLQRKVDELTAELGPLRTAAATIRAACTDITNADTIADHLDAIRAIYDAIDELLGEPGTAT
jgi:uncharacterized membrane protein